MTNITRPAFVTNAINGILSRMSDQIGKTGENGKPILNAKTVAKLATVSRIWNKVESGKALTLRDQVDMVRCLHVSEGMTAKLSGVNAISSACSVNPVCQARANDCNSICAHCFAFLTFDRYDGLQQAAIINFIVLNTAVYSVKAWRFASIPASDEFDMFRIEAFGDTASAVQCANYIRIAQAYRHIPRFGVWSKNLGFWSIAFNAYGKPSNVIFNASSPVVDMPMTVKPEYARFVDHVFTVYSADYALTHDVNITCGDRICAHCKRCYTGGNGIEVNEILKQESKRYYKAIGKSFSGRK